MSAGQDAAVQFGQHDVHGKIGGREATLVFFPDVAPGGGDDDLEDRHAGAVEQGFDAGSAPEAKAVAVMMAAGSGKQGRSRQRRVKPGP